MSYSNTAYNIAGRVIEVLTGQVWDEALRTLVLDPLHAIRTGRCRRMCCASAPRWATPSPRTPGGRSRLRCGSRDSAATGRAAASSRRPTTYWPSHACTCRTLARDDARAPGRGAAPDGRPLGSWLEPVDLGRAPGVRRTTATPMGAQSGSMRVVPDKGVAMVLLTNIADSTGFQLELFGELLRELCGIAIPPRPSPPAEPVRIDDLGRFVGTYERVGARLDITLDSERAAPATALHGHRDHGRIRPAVRVRPDTDLRHHVRRPYVRRRPVDHSGLQRQVHPPGYPRLPQNR